MKKENEVEQGITEIVPKFKPVVFSELSDKEKELYNESVDGINQQYKDVLFAVHGKDVDKKFVEQAKKEFEEAKDKFNDSTYTVIKAEDAKRALPVLLDFFENHCIWEGTFWAGIIKMVDLVKAELEWARAQKKNRDWVVDTSATFVLATLFKGISGTYETARWWEQNESILAPVIVAVSENYETHTKEYKYVTALQDRWGFAFNGFYTIPIRGNEEKVEKLRAEQYKKLGK